MKTQILALPAILLASVALHAADAKTEPSNGTAAAFSQLKSLVGEWQADTEMGKSHLTYELIAGGTALVERETAEKMPEMLTVYHVDGDHLLLTHYCAAGNQPRMQAQPFDPQTREIRFRFLNATNLTTPGAGHMHNATVRFVDDRHLITEWQFYENNQLKFTETAQYTRVR
jgi:hypothetical protein